MNATKEISFKTTRHEAELIGVISRAASKLAQKHGVDYDGMTANMDITACHANGMRLDLNLLKIWAETNSFNFAHDVFGIRRHINRETGEIENCFVPRCAEKS